jgi:hypothetical protein
VDRVRDDYPIALYRTIDQLGQVIEATTHRASAYLRVLDEVAVTPCPPSTKAAVHLILTNFVSCRPVLNAQDQGLANFYESMRDANEGARGLTE